MENYGKHFDMNIKMVDASGKISFKLAGIGDPEEKRKSLVTSLFTFSMKNQNKSEGAKILGSGNNLSDVIESQSVQTLLQLSVPSQCRRTSKEMEFELLEPLRELFR